jgi:phage-related protein
VDPIEKLKVVIGNLKESFGAGLFPVIGVAAEALGGLATTLQPALEALGGSLGDAFKPLLDIIGPIVTTLIQSFSGIITGITPGLTVLATAFTETFATFGPIIVTAFSAVGNAISTVMVALAPLVDIFGSLLSTFLPPLTTALTIVADVFSAVLGPVLGAIAPIIKDLGEQIGPVLTQALTTLGPAIGNVAYALGTAFGDALTTLAPVITEMVSLLSDALLSAVQQLAPLFVDLAQKIGPLIATFVGQLAPILPTIVKAFMDLASALLGGLLTVLPTIADAFFQVLNAVLPLVPTLLSLLTTVIIPLIPALVNSLAPILPTLATAFVQIVQAVLPLVPVMLGLLTNIIIPLIPQVIGLVTSLVSFLSQTKLLIPVVAGLATAFAGWKVISTFSPAVKTLNTTLTAGKAALAAYKAAQAGATAATIAADGATKAQKVGLAAFKIQQVASAAATKVVTAAQWLWNAALNANPIGLVVVAVAALVGAIVLAYKKIGPFRDLMDSIGRWFRDTLFPVIKQVAGVIGGALKSAFDAVLPIIKAVWNIFKGLYIQPVIDAFKALAKLFTGDFKGALEGVKNLFSNLGDTFGKMGDLAGKLISGLWGAIQALGAWLISTGLPWLGEKFVELFGKIPGLLGDLGSLLWGAVKAAFDWVVQNGPAILSALGAWFIGIPLKILGWLGNFGLQLVEWFVKAFGWVVTNGAKIIANVAAWFVTLPFKLLALVINLGAMLVEWMVKAFQWVVTNGPGIIAGIVGWFTSLPGKFLSLLASLGGLLIGWLKAAWDWLATNGPGIIMGFLSFVGSIPGKILSGLGALGSTLWGWLKGAFDYVVRMAPIAISGLVGFFSSLPGKLFDALGAAVSGAGKIAGKVLDFGKTLWDALKGFIKTKVLIPIADIEILGKKPFDRVRRLLADGDIITKPTQAIIGEAGPEVVVPLSDTRTLSNFVAGRAKFTSGVVNRATPVTLGRRPEVVLPLSRPQRALSLASRALGMARTPQQGGTAMGLAPTGNNAVRSSGRMLLAAGAIFKPGGAAVKIASMGEIAPPKGFVAAMKMLGELKAVKAAGISAADMGIQGGTYGSFAPRTVAQHLQLIKALLDDGYRGTIFEDGAAKMQKKGGKVFNLGSYPEAREPFLRAFLSESATGKFLAQLERVHDFFIAVKILTGQGTSILPKGDGLKVKNKEARKALTDAGFPLSYQPLITSKDGKTKSGGFWRLGTQQVSKDKLKQEDPFTLLTALPFMRAMAVQMVMRTNEVTAKNFAEKFNEMPRVVQNQLAARPYEPGGTQYNALLQASLLPRVGAFAEGGIVNGPQMGLVGEAGREVIIPLSRPARAAQLVRESGLISTVAQAEPATAAAVGVAAGAADGGILGGGPGNTYVINGISMDQVMAEIRARDEATVRVRR